MSGTSLDGVDLTYCEFNNPDDWKFNLIHAETVSYTDSWRKILGELHDRSAEKIYQISQIISISAVYF